MVKTTELERLEQELGPALSEARSVLPNSDFVASLRDRLANAKVSADTDANFRVPAIASREIHWSSTRYGKLLRTFAAAAAAVAVIVGSLTYLPTQSSVSLVSPQTPRIGAMVLAAERPSAPSVPGVLPLQSARAMPYVVKAEPPALSEHIPIYQLSPIPTEANDLATIAERLGINAKVQHLPVGDGSGRPDLMVTDGRSTIRLEGSTGMLLYEGETVLSTTGEISSEAARQAALDWLKQAGLLPAEDIRVTVKNPYAERTDGVSPYALKLVTVQPAWLATDDEGLGWMPSWHLTVNTQGRVIAASGQWAKKQGEIDLPLRDYTAALNALQKGEGFVRTTDASRSSEQFTAQISTLSWSYAQASALDGGVYLVPVIVVRGQLEQAGATPSSFSGYASLLPAPEGKNIANYVLAGSLPRVSGQAQLLGSQVLGSSDAADLARRLGVSGELIPSTSINTATYAYLGTTADGWRLQIFTNGSWIFDCVRAQASNLNQVSASDAVSAARSYIRGLDFAVDEPLYLGAGLVSFPMLYSGAPVLSSSDGQAVSALIVGVGENKEIQSVRCDQQMQSLAGSTAIITPEEAWQKLLANEGTVMIQGFGLIAGREFVATGATVGDARLVYLQRIDQRSGEFTYLPAYQFRGHALVGEGKTVQFFTVVTAGAR